MSILFPEKPLLITLPSRSTPLSTRCLQLQELGIRLDPVMCTALIAAAKGTVAEGNRLLSGITFQQTMNVGEAVKAVAQDGEYLLTRLEDYLQFLRDPASYCLARTCIFTGPPVDSLHTFSKSKIMVPCVESREGNRGFQYDFIPLDVPMQPGTVFVFVSTP